MDTPGSTLSRAPNSSDVSPADRFLGFLAHAPSLSSSADELNEDDIFSCGDDFSDPNRHRNLSSDIHYSTPPSSSSACASTTPRLQHRGKKVSTSAFGPSESFGILAALPEKELHSVFNHKASISSPSSSSASSALVIPKPPVLPVAAQRERFSAAKHYQSAPVNVPVFPQALQAARRRHKEFDEIDDDDGDNDLDDDGAMLPPHEIVARSLARTSMLSCSVLEGAGRTLKGRDLRQVRNAVFRQTGFID